MEIIAATFVLSGCTTGSVTLSDPLAQHSKVATVQIVSADNTVAIQPEAAKYFEDRLRQYLYEAGEGRFNEGDEMTITYRFIQFDEGSRAARYFIGFGAGKETMTVEVAFRTQGGAEVGKINVGGEISRGVFGGDFDEAIGVAAKQAVDFANNNFALES